MILTTTRYVTTKCLTLTYFTSFVKKKKKKKINRFLLATDYFLNFRKYCDILLKNKNFSKQLIFTALIRDNKYSLYYFLYISLNVVIILLFKYFRFKQYCINVKK